jgi:hypothetical protein
MEVFAHADLFQSDSSNVGDPDHIKDTVHVADISNECDGRTADQKPILFAVIAVQENANVHSDLDIRNGGWTQRAIIPNEGLLRDTHAKSEFKIPFK